MTDDEVNQKIAEYGIEQFVRNTMVSVLEEGIDCSLTPEEIARTMDERLLLEFRELAQAASRKVLMEMSQFMKEDK